MNCEEAIGVLESIRRKENDDYIKTQKLRVRYNDPLPNFGIKALDTAIYALTELQRYKRLEADGRLYQVEVEVSGYMHTSECQREEKVELDTVYHIGRDTNYTIFCRESDIQAARERLIRLCVEHLDKGIEKNKAKKRIL